VAWLSDRPRRGAMRPRLRFRFWGESAAAAVACFLSVLTLVWPAWVEGVLGIEPDHGNGSFEWGLVVGCWIATGMCAAIARQEWRRAQPTRGEV
jgi:hypothetical protein